MNGSVLAALVVAALLVIVLMLKNRASQKKSMESEADEQPIGLLSQPEEERADTVGPAVAEEKVAGAVEADEVCLIEPEVVPEVEGASDVTDETVELSAPLAAQPVTIAGDELEFVDLKSEPVLAEPDEVLEMIELEAVPVDTSSIPEIAVIEEAPEREAETVSAVPVKAVVEQETASATEAETLASLGADEKVPASEPFPPDTPAKAEEEGGLADLPAAPTPGDFVLPLVRLTLDAYSTRLNGLEERQRSLLTQAIGSCDDTLRDRLQRELVIMNDKLALLADSYVEEVASYQQVLEALEQLHGQIGGTALEAAIEQLRNGDGVAAEEFLASLAEQPPPFAARIAFSRGQLAESRVDLQQALDLYRHAVEQEPDNLSFLHAAGRTARSLYNYKAALPWLETFVRLSRESSENDPLALALAQRELAYTYVLSGQYQKAGPLYKESMTMLAKKLGQDHPEMATSWCQIGELQETLGEYDKAVSLYKKALVILEKKRGPEHPVLASILDKLAALCMELEMEKEAVPLYERLVRIREKALRPTHPQLAISLNSLAESYRLQGRYADAFACYQKSLVINETLHGPEHPSVAAILQELAKLCTSQRQPEEAKQYQERAAAIFQKSVDASEKKSGAEALTLEL
jgi:tetratricopeptide (TPR) repeat protein